MFFRERNVGEGMLDVAAALLAIVGRPRIRGQSLKKFEGFVERDSPAGRDVEYFPRYLRPRSFAGQQIGLNRIVDVGEIPALLAIPKHGRLRAAQHLRDELCQYAGVR